MIKNSYIAGFDEAGLGPILGPLVVSGVIINSNDFDVLRRIGVDDSKKFGSTYISRNIRKIILYRSMRYLLHYDYRAISAREIDEEFIRGFNMYELEIRAISEIIASSKLFEEKSDIIILHQIGTLKKENMIKKLKKNGVDQKICDKIVYEKKADQKYVPVSMASIVSKVTRDKNLENITKSICGEYVSGYPTNKTCRFLERYLLSERRLSEYVRFTRDWGPLNNLKDRCKYGQNLLVCTK